MTHGNIPIGNMTREERLAANVDPDRGTGRTTRMVRDAVFEAAKGKQVAIVMGSHDQRHQLWAKFPGIKKLEIPVFGIYDTVVRLDGSRLPFIRGQRFDVVYADHSVYDVIDRRV